MWLVRCSGSARGFRVDGKFYPFHSWTVIDAPTDNELKERMLTCVEVQDATDTRLSPFPIDTTDPDMKTPTLQGLAEQVKEWRGRFEALGTSIHEVTQRADAAIAENSSLKDQLVKSDRRAFDERIRLLEGDLLKAQQKIAELEKQAALTPGPSPPPASSADAARREPSGERGDAATTGNGTVPKAAAGAK